MKIDSLTDIGVRRKDNQDNYWCSRLDINGEEAGVICLCDGMGGLEQGALASRVVVEKVKDYFRKSIDFTGLELAVKSANEEIHGLAEDSKISGTTCTILLCFRNVYKILHVGDTRCYRVSDDGIKLLTEDHSVLAEYKRRGVTLPDVYVKKYRNSLTRCVGVKENLSLDYIEGSYDEGDIFVVCSDGLWHYFDNYVWSKDYLSDLKSLIGRCIDSGETDNISIGVLRI